LLAASVDLLEASERIVVIDDHDLTIDTIRRIARKEVEAGAAMVILDYLQLLEKKAESRERAVAQISRDLKNMAKELNVPVICLAQMNRSVESENRLPRLSDLRESGAIEQDANAVLFIHKTGDLQDGKKQVALIMAKGRDVGEGFRKGIFNANHQRFYAVEA
jgi:replicative DNA helicase